VVTPTHLTRNERDLFQQLRKIEKQKNGDSSRDDEDLAS
jgi:hypothetical protein